MPPGAFRSGIFTTHPPSELMIGRAFARAPKGEAMSDDQSQLGIVLANAPRLEKAFGRKWAAFITLVSLYFARRPSGIVSFVASFLFVAALALQAWLKMRG